MKLNIRSLAPLTLALCTHYLSYTAAPTTNQPDFNEPAPITQQHAVLTEDTAISSDPESVAGQPTNTAPQVVQTYNPPSLHYLAAKTIIHTLVKDLHNQQTTISHPTPDSPTWAQEMSRQLSKAPEPNTAQQANTSYTKSISKKEKAPYKPQINMPEKKPTTVARRTYPIRPGIAPVSPFKLDQENQRVPQELYAYLDFLYTYLNFDQSKKTDSKSVPYNVCKSETENNKPEQKSESNTYKTDKIILNQILCAIASNATLFGPAKQKLIADLITDGAQVNAHSQDICQRTPLLIAAQHGDVDTIKTLLDLNADTNHFDRSDWTALITAALNGHVEAMLTLIHNGVDPNQENPHGWTPLLAAAQKGHLPVIEALCSLPNINPQQTNKIGENALMWAARNGHIDVVNFLMHIPTIDINHENSSNWTALSAAASKQHLEIVQKLLTHTGINPNPADNEGVTPLMWAVLHKNIDMVKLLLDAPDMRPNMADSSGRTALSIAQQNKHTEIITLLEGALSRD